MPARADAWPSSAGFPGSARARCCGRSAPSFAPTRVGFELLTASGMPVGSGIAYGALRQLFGSLAASTPDGEAPFDGPGALLRRLVLGEPVDRRRRGRRLCGALGDLLARSTFRARDRARRRAVARSDQRRRDRDRAGAGGRRVGRRRRRHPRVSARDAHAVRRGPLRAGRRRRLPAAARRGRDRRASGRRRDSSPPRCARSPAACRSTSPSSAR